MLKKRLRRGRPKDREGKKKDGKVRSVGLQDTQIKKFNKKKRNQRKGRRKEKEITLGGNPRKVKGRLTDRF